MKGEFIGPDGASTDYDGRRETRAQAEARKFFHGAALKLIGTPFRVGDTVGYRTRYEAINEARSLTDELFPGVMPEPTP